MEQQNSHIWTDDGLQGHESERGEELQQFNHTKGSVLDFHI